MLAKKTKRKYTRKAVIQKVAVEKPTPTIIIKGRGNGGWSDFNGTTIYQNTEEYYSSTPTPQEEIPPFNFWEAYRRVCDVAATFAGINAELISSAKLTLAVPENPDWKNRHNVLTQKSRIKRGLTVKNIEYGTLDYVDILDLDHPIVKTLYNPNDLMLGTSDLIKVIMMQLQWFGDCFIYKLWQKDRLMLIPLNPLECPLVMDRGSFQAPRLRLLGQTATKVFGEGAAPNSVLEADKFIHLKIAAPNRYYYGYGYLEQSWKSVILEQEKTGADCARQKNLMNGDVIVRFDENTPQELMDEALESMETKMRGSRNTGSMIGYRANGGIDIQAMQHAIYEIGLPEQVTKKIALAFRFPYAEFDGVNSNKASYITAYNGYIDKQTSIAHIIETGLTTGLANEFPEIEPGFKLYFNNIRKEDEQDKLDQLQYEWEHLLIDKHTYLTLAGRESSEEDRGVMYTPVPQAIHWTGHAPIGADNAGKEIDTEENGSEDGVDGEGDSGNTESEKPVKKE
jgi:hypothetical protein